MSWPKGKIRKNIEIPVVFPNAAGITRKEIQEIKASVVSQEPIENVPPRTLCKQCKHDKEKHYGGEKGWCNVMDCVCQEHQ